MNYSDVFLMAEAWNTYQVLLQSLHLKKKNGNDVTVVPGIYLIQNFSKYINFLNKIKILIVLYFSKCSAYLTLLDLIT